MDYRVQNTKCIRATVSRVSTSFVHGIMQKGDIRIQQSTEWVSNATMNMEKVYFIVKYGLNMEQPFGKRHEVFIFRHALRVNQLAGKDVNLNG
jgi:hypothetical protein